MNNTRRDPAEILPFLESVPCGADIDQIAAVLKVQRTRASELMTRWRKEGHVVHLGGGKVRLWTVPSNAAYVAAMIKEGTRLKMKMWKRKHLERVAEARIAETRDMMPRHILCKACDCQPLPKLGPASVFEWANL